MKTTFKERIKELKIEELAKLEFEIMKELNEESKRIYNATFDDEYEEYLLDCAYAVEYAMTWEGEVKGYTKEEVRAYLNKYFKERTKEM